MAWDVKWQQLHGYAWLSIAYYDILCTYVPNFLMKYYCQGYHLWSKSRFALVTACGQCLGRITVFLIWGAFFHVAVFCLYRCPCLFSLPSTVLCRDSNCSGCQVRQDLFCSRISCEVWSTWAVCSETCGGGSSSRSREVRYDVDEWETESNWPVWLWPEKWSRRQLQKTKGNERGLVQIGNLTYFVFRSKLRFASLAGEIAKAGRGQLWRE